MAKRQNVMRLDSAHVQGEDSWVEVRRPTVGERLESLSKEQGLDGRFLFDSNSQEVCTFVIAWNWVDDEGQPLPTPKDQPDIYKALTTDEISFLLEAVWGSASTRKN